MVQSPPHLVDFPANPYERTPLLDLPPHLSWIEITGLDFHIDINDYIIELIELNKSKQYYNSKQRMFTVFKDN